MAHGSNNENVYTTLHPPGYQEEVVTTRHEGHPPLVEFMKNFRVELVSHPGVTPENYIAGQHPYWVSQDNAILLRDPIINRPIAVYDYEFNTPWFISRGYLKKNPRVPGDYQFSWDPQFQPYKEEDEGFEGSKLGVLDYMNKLNLAALVENASPKIKEIVLVHKSLTYDGEDNLAKNTKVLLLFLMENLYKGFGEKFGYSEDSVKLLFGKDHEEILSKKLEIISPGLTQKKDLATNKIIDLPIREAILRRFHYENRKRRDDLAIPISRKKSEPDLVCDFCQTKFDKLEDLEKHQVGVHGTLVQNNLLSDENSGSDGASGSKTREKTPPPKKIKTDIDENDLYESCYYVVSMSEDEIQIAENALSNFKEGNDIEVLWEATKMLQRVNVGMTLKDLFDRFPWLKLVLYQIKQFSWIMTAKFENKLADQYFIEVATDSTKKLFKFWLKNKQLKGVESDYITSDAPLTDQLIHSLESLDTFFSSKLFTKIDATTEDSKVVTKAFTPLPSVLLSGTGYQKLSVCFNGHLLGKFDRDGAITAHALQLSTLYNFGASFEKSSTNKALPKKFRNYFDFITIYFWQVRTKFISSGTGKPIQKRASRECQKLLDDISSFKPT